MVDFCSLPQKDVNGARTKDEQATFKEGLTAMSAVYASPRVTVLQHKAVPEGVAIKCAPSPPSTHTHVTLLVTTPFSRL